MKMSALYELKKEDWDALHDADIFFQPFKSTYDSILELVKVADTASVIKAKAKTMAKSVYAQMSCHNHIQHNCVVTYTHYVIELGETERAKFQIYGKLDGCQRPMSASLRLDLNKKDEFIYGPDEMEPVLLKFVKLCEFSGSKFDRVSKDQTLEVLPEILADIRQNHREATDMIYFNQRKAFGTHLLALTALFLSVVAIILAL